MAAWFEWNETEHESHDRMIDRKDEAQEWIGLIILWVKQEINKWT